MKHKTPQRKYGLPALLKLTVALVAAFCLLIAWGIFLVRDKLLLNADEMGTYLAQSYAVEEENRNSVYQLFMNLGALYLDDKIEQHSDDDQIQGWMARYSENISQTLGAFIIDPYAVIDGHIIAAEPCEGDDAYDYSSTEWYQRALAADGKIIFTNAYSDAITGKQLITMARTLDGSDNVLAFDIFLENFHVHKNKASMPEGSSYFLFDASGQRLYVSSDKDFSTPEGTAYLEELLAGIRSGELESHSAFIEDPDGEKRGVYYYAMSNGWLSVITIPLQGILQDGWDRAILMLTLVCVALIVMVIAVLVRGYLTERRQRRAEDTLKILGNTFYAIYWIDFDTGTYETVKSSEDVREELGSGGNYQDFLNIFREYVSDETYEEFQKSFSLENIRKLVGQGVYEYGGDYRRRFGSDFKWVSIRIVYNVSLQLNQVIMSFREIDQEKRRQLQQQVLLENALNAAKQTVQKKTAFFSSVSHDLRTPLNAIIGLSDLARQKADTLEAARDYLGRIEQSGKQMLTLVNDVLEMSRVEHGEGSSLEYAPMDLVQCVKENAAMFEAQVEREGKKLQVISDVAAPVVYCDPVRMGQILANLISNAVKYSLEGAEITVEVRMTAQQGPSGRYQIVVRDTGIGMSEAFLERIFEPFTRETVFSPTKVTGTGLGMPIVQSLVRQMSGEITVQSQLGKGTVFTVTLPLQIAEEAQPKPAAEAPARQVDHTGRRILVAEDNEINMEILTEYLAMMGVEVLQAWNGREAVDVFSSQEAGTVDAILMDMQMPEMDGCEACQAIRAMERSDAATVPIIAVTANAFAEDIARTTDAGMNDHISKPIDFQLLMEVLGKYLNGTVA